MSIESSKSFRVDLEGRFIGPRPEGRALKLSQVACVLTAALRSQGVEEATEITIKEDGQPLVLETSTPARAKEIEILIRSEEDNHRSSPNAAEPHAASGDEE